MSKHRPKFDSLYSGEWPYESMDGVGMYFEGIPNDRDKFIETLMDYACHPKASARIYSRIREHGFDRLTVMFNLPFDEIAVVLKGFGVTMKIIPPLEGWKHRHEDGPYPASFIPPHMRRRRG